MSLAELIRSDLADVFFNTSDFASTCRYEGMAVPLVVSQHEGQRQREVGQVGDALARDVEFLGMMATLAESDPTWLPSAGEVIEWTDADNQPHEFVVFPRVNGRWFDFADQSRDMIRIYAVPAVDLSLAEIGGVEYRAMLGPLRVEDVPIVDGTQERWVTRDVCRAAILCAPGTVTPKTKIILVKHTQHESTQDIEAFYVRLIESVTDALTVVDAWRESLTKVQRRGVEGA